MTDTTARDALDAALDAACPADEGHRLLDAYRDQVLAEASDALAHLLGSGADSRRSQGIAFSIGVLDGLRNAPRSITTPHACDNCEGIDPATCLYAHSTAAQED